MSLDYIRLISLATLATTLLIQPSCGLLSHTRKSSKIQFIQGSRQQSAFLEDKDLKDDFIFGMAVIDSTGLNSTIYDMQYKTSVVSLAIDRTSQHLKLNIVTNQSGIPLRENHSLAQSQNLLQPGDGILMSFDAKQDADGRIEVDFSAPGNELDLYSPSSKALLHGTYEGSDQRWRTVGLPQVLNVTQTADLVVADIRHHVGVSKGAGEAQIHERDAGFITFRIFLKRRVYSQVHQPPLLAIAGFAKNIGYLEVRSNWAGTNGSVERYAVDTSSRKEGQIVVYLKNFPSDYYSVGEAAILAWNKAFGFNAIAVRPATDGIDLGDPRYNVVRWMDGFDTSVYTAGVSNSIVDPFTGNVTGQIRINGSSLLKSLQSRSEYTASALSGFAGLHGKIGKVPLIQSSGETPVAPFFTDPSVDFKTYARAYYHSVIMHEFGHSLGLGHNFAGSTVLDNGGTSSSVMDYLPYWATHRMTGIGSYDMAAIRWGYFGEAPQNPLVYCNEGNLETRFDCNTDDLGDPIASTVADLITGTAVLSGVPVVQPKGGRISMEVQIRNGFKILNLISQVPEAKQEETQIALTEALRAVRDSKVSTDLTAADQDIIGKNLNLLHSSFQKVFESFSSRILL